VPQGMAWTTKTQNGLGLRWDAARDNVGVTGYRLYVDGALAATTTQTSHTISGLKCGTSYTVGLTAIDAAGNESNRAEATGTTSTEPCAVQDTEAPSVPQGMAWTTRTQTSIGLSWDAASDNVGVAGYRIYRNGTLVDTTTDTSYSVGGLACGTSYTIALSAIDAAGNESDRAAATGTMSTEPCAPQDTQAPSAPQNMEWTTKTQNSLGLRWDAATDNVGVTGYRLYVDGRLAATTTQTTYTITGLECGTTYTVGLTAIDAAGNQSYRSAATATTKTRPCGPLGSNLLDPVRP
jgi:chitodextrinase